MLNPPFESLPKKTTEMFSINPANHACEQPKQGLS